MVSTYLPHNSRVPAFPPSQQTNTAIAAWRDILSDIAHIPDRQICDRMPGALRMEVTMRLVLIDYATMAFALMAVAFGPAIVWTMLYLASR